jgi:hypothetical protein
MQSCRFLTWALWGRAPACLSYVTGCARCSFSVSVEGEYALVVAAVVAAGVGDVGEPGAAECACDQVADGGAGIGLVPGADPLEIFGECLVSDVVRTVFNGPVAAGVKARGGFRPGPWAGW